MLHLLFFFACSDKKDTSPSTIDVDIPINKVSMIPSTIPLPPADVRMRCHTHNGPMEIHVFEGLLTWGDLSQEIDADVHAITCADLDRDGSEEAYLGFGVGRSHPKAIKQIWKVTESAATVYWQDEAGRNQITGLIVHDSKLYLTAFTEGTTVAGGPLINGEWVPDYAVPLALTQVPFDNGVLIGRVYGDKPRSDGDLKKYSDAGMDNYPVEGGVRAIGLADVNGDNKTDMLISDGWNFQYGKHARARVRAYLGPTYDDVRTLANFDDDYTVNDIIPVKLNGVTSLIVQASHHVYLIEPDLGGWKTHTIGPIDESGLMHKSEFSNVQTIFISGNPSLKLEIPL